MTSDRNNPSESAIEHGEVGDKQQPLSRAPGLKKIMICVPGALLSAGLAYLGLFTGLTRMLAVILAAYACVGVVEIIGGESLVNLGKKWDILTGWKKFVISIAVIVVAIIVLIVVMPMVAVFFR